MSNRIISRFQQLWAKFKIKAYRDAFVASQLQTNVAAQIVTMREDRNWTQQQLADETGMSQPRISLLEDPSYDKMTLSTLKRLASAFDVGIVVRFVSFSDVLRWAETAETEKFSVQSFEVDYPSEVKSEVVRSPGSPISVRLFAHGSWPDASVKVAPSMIRAYPSASSYLVAH